ELHPDIPRAGRALRPNGRLALVHADIARQCADVDLPFRAPTKVPNSRRALETAEVVRSVDATAFAVLDSALFRSHFVDGDDIGDTEVLDHLVTDAGASASEIRGLVDRGAGGEAVTASMRAAHEHGVAATPAWLFDEELGIPGAQPRELFERIVARLRTRRE